MRHNKKMRDCLWDLKQSIKKHEWEEAMKIIEEMEKEFPSTISVCASCSQAKCKFPKAITAKAFLEAGITRLEATVLECENYTKKDGQFG